MKPTDLQSKVIAFIRFPLIVMVLFSHCNYRTISDEWANLAVASGVIDVISQRIAPIANPFFFFIAGYLFFKSGAFSINLYIKKLIIGCFAGGVLAVADDVSLAGVTLQDAGNALAGGSGWHRILVAKSVAGEPVMPPSWEARLVSLDGGRVALELHDVRGTCIIFR